MDMIQTPEETAMRWAVKCADMIPLGTPVCYHGTSYQVRGYQHGLVCGKPAPLYDLARITGSPVGKDTPMEYRVPERDIVV